MSTPEAKTYRAQTGVLIAISSIVAVGVLGVVFSKENATQIIGFCSITVVSLLALLQGIIAATKVQETAVKLDEAAVKVEQVKQTLHDESAKTEEKLMSLAKVTKDTHTLVNSNMGIQLTISATALRRLADITGNGADAAAAKIAEDSLHEHEAKQRVVDHGMGVTHGDNDGTARDAAVETLKHMKNGKKTTDQIDPQTSLKPPKTGP